MESTTISVAPSREEAQPEDGWLGPTVHLKAEAACTAPLLQHLQSSPSFAPWIRSYFWLCFAIFNISSRLSPMYRVILFCVGFIYCSFDIITIAY